jgi:hypothetical protein
VLCCDVLQAARGVGVVLVVQLASSRRSASSSSAHPVSSSSRAQECAAERVGISSNGVYGVEVSCVLVRWGVWRGFGRGGQLGFKSFQAPMVSRW